MPLEIESIRRRWTPYAVLDEGTMYRVCYVPPRQIVPPATILFLIPVDSDGEIAKISAAVADLLFNMPTANDMPA